MITYKSVNTVRPAPRSTVASKPGLTRPNLAMSVQEIHDRFVTGRSLPDTLNGGYSDVDFTQLERLDKFQRLDYARNLAIKQEQIKVERQRELNELYKKRRSDAYAERVRKDVEAELARRSGPQPSKM